MHFLSRLGSYLPWVLISLLAVAVGFYQHQLEDVKKQLESEMAYSSTREAQLATATAFNASLNTTIESLNQQLIDARLADEMVRQFNTAVDSKLEATLSDLDKAFNEQNKTNTSDSSEQFSESVYRRMLKHYAPTITATDNHD